MNETYAPFFVWLPILMRDPLGPYRVKPWYPSEPHLEGSTPNDLASLGLGRREAGYTALRGE